MEANNINDLRREYKRLQQENMGETSFESDCRMVMIEQLEGIGFELKRIADYLREIKKAQ